MLEGFFAPGSVAVVGVARDEGKVGHYVFDNLRAAGFAGPVWPVNPNAEEIHGVPCYPSVRDLPGVPDLVVIVVPAPAVAAVIDDCIAAGVSSAIVISAGFKEAGRDGGALERDIARRAAGGGMRLLGPNCLGLVATASDLNASFASRMPPSGGISFLSQSGALGTAVLDWAEGEGLGLAHFVSLGNRADLTESDLLEAWRDAPGTKVVVAYLESVADGPRFIRSALATSACKPVIVLKSGGSDAGARAVSSHTGSLAGSEAAYEAAFHRAGVVRARTVEDLFDCAVAFSHQPLPGGQGVAIVTNAGGPAVLATDACERAGLSLASFESETLARLSSFLPSSAALYNPVDILGDAPPERYRQTLEAVYDDPNVRAVICLLTPQAMTDPTRTAGALVEVSGRHSTTTLACFMGRDGVQDARATLRAGGVPAYDFPERAVRALAAMHEYGGHLARPGIAPPVFEPDRDRVRAIIDEARERGRTFITEESAARIGAAYGLRVARGGVASDLGAAKRLAAEIGYPVVAKIASPDILHKSDIGGIAVGIGSEADLASAYDRILGRARTFAPDADISGIHIQEMLQEGREVIIGVDRDSTFGPVLMFGLGGVYVEVMKDITFRLCPIDQPEAREMLAEIRGYGLLRGARGQRPADVDAVVDALVRVSALAADFPDIVELDVNPLIVGDAGSGAVVADIRIGIGGAR